MKKTKKPAEVTQLTVKAGLKAPGTKRGRKSRTKTIAPAPPAKEDWVDTLLKDLDIDVEEEDAPEKPEGGVD